MEGYKEFTSEELKGFTYRDIITNGREGAKESLYALYEERYNIVFPKEFKTLWDHRNGGDIEDRLCFDESGVVTLAYLDQKLMFRFKSWDTQVCSIEDIVNYIPEFFQYKQRLRKKEWISRLIVFAYGCDELTYACLDYRESDKPKMCIFSFRDCDTYETAKSLDSCFKVW